MDQRQQRGVEQVFGPVSVPATFDASSYGRAIYPDIVDNRKGVATFLAMVPFLFFAGLPIQTQVRAGGNHTLLVYARTHASRMPSWFGPPAPPVAPPVGLSTPPARVPRHVPDYNGWYTAPPRTPEAPYTFTAAYYPDRIDRLPQSLSGTVAPILPINQQARAGGNETALIWEESNPSLLPSWFGPVSPPVSAVTYAAAYYPDQVRAPRALDTGGTAPFVFLPPTPFTQALYPATIHRDRPQPTPVAVAPVRQPEPRFFQALYPDRIDRHSPQPTPVAVAPIRQPEPRFFAAYYPATIDRGSLPALGGTFAPVRQPVPIFTAAYYPARLDRIYQDFSLTTKPVFPPPAPYVLAVYPDRIDRARPEPTPGTAPPYQETPAVVVTYAAAYYPDQVVRLTAPVTSGAFVPLPATPFSAAVYPATVDRLPTTHPAAVTAPVRQPVPPFFAALYPSRLDPRPQAAATVTVLPVRQPVPQFFAAIYPARLDRVSQDFAVLVTPILPPPAPYSAAVYPLTIHRDRPQPTGATLPPVQPRPPAPPLSWAPCYPDRAIRLWAVAVYNPGVDYGTLEPIIPPVVAGGQSTAGLGQKKTWSDMNELGGGGW